MRGFVAACNYTTHFPPLTASIQVADFLGKKNFTFAKYRSFFSSKYDIAPAQLREFSEKNVDEKNVKEGSDYV